MKTKTNFVGANKQASLMEEIPLEVLKRVPVKSVCRLRCVCKPLSRILSSPYFISMHSRWLISTNNAFAEESQLMIRFLRSSIKDSGGITSLQSADINPKHISAGRFDSSEILSISQFGNREYVVCFCFHNFLCLNNQKGNGTCFLFDPFRGEILNLPQLPSSDKIHQTFFGMGFDETNNTYKIIQISIVSNTSIVALVHVLGTRSWRKIHPPCWAADLKLKETICAYGNALWIFRNLSKKRCCIHSFDFTKEEFNTLPHPQVRNSNLHYITLKGRLAVITLDLRNNMDIWIMKDYSTKEWTLDHHLITEPQTSEPDIMFSSSLDCGEWDHGIFFVLHGNESYFFDLRERDAALHPKYVKIDGNKYWKGYRDHLIFILERTLISLQQLQHQRSAASNLYTLPEFSKKYLWHQGGKPCGTNRLFFL